MARITMTKDRGKCGCKINKAGDTKRGKDKDGNSYTWTFVKEIIKRDPDDNIIGVVSIWQ